VGLRRDESALAWFRRDELGEGVGEVGEVVAFGAEAGQADVVRVDSEGAELVGEPVEWGAAGGGRKTDDGRLVGAEGFEELFGGHAGRAGLGEDLTDGGQKLDGKIVGAW